jgi:hypothetical protein
MTKPTVVNDMQLTTETVYRVGKIEGPFKKTPSGKFDRKGNPVMVACTPYWVVRTVHGANASIMQERTFFAENTAAQYYDSLQPMAR